jgi:hypothetical protein
MGIQNYSVGCGYDTIGWAGLRNSYQILDVDIFRLFSLNISRLIRREFFRNKKPTKLCVSFLEKRCEFI